MDNIDIFNSNNDPQREKKRRTFVAPKVEGVSPAAEPAPELGIEVEVVHVSAKTAAKKSGASKVSGRKRGALIGVSGGVAAVAALGVGAFIFLGPSSSVQDSAAPAAGTSTQPPAPVESPSIPAPSLTTAPETTEPDLAQGGETIVIPEEFTGKEYSAESVIGFEPDSASLSTEGLREIERIVSQIPEGSQAEVVGYVSAKASGSKFTLDQRRAETVASELRDRGVSVLSVEGRGKKQRAVIIAWKLPSGS